MDDSISFLLLHPPSTPLPLLPACLPAGEYFGHHEDAAVACMHAWIDRQHHQGGGGETLAGVTIDAALRALLEDGGHLQRPTPTVSEVSTSSPSPFPIQHHNEITCCPSHQSLVKSVPVSRSPQLSASAATSPVHARRSSHRLGVQRLDCRRLSTRATALSVCALLDLRHHLA